MFLMDKYVGLSRMIAMRKNHTRRFPFIGIGLLLLAISGAPAVVGMLRDFNQLQHGQDPSAVQSGVGLAFHPAFIACSNVGLLLLVIGIARALRRSGSPAA